MKILHVNANPKPLEESASQQVSQAFVQALKQSHSGAEVHSVNLYDDPPDFYSYQAYRHFWYPVFQPDYQPSEEEQKAAEYAKRHAERLKQADILVLTTPMWNFSVAGILKAWMDQVLAPNLIFTLGPEGVKPLHKIKKVIVLTASGGVYPKGDQKDNLDPLIKAAFGFIGVENIEVVSADGQNTFFFKDSIQRKESAIESAKRLAEQL